MEKCIACGKTALMPETLGKVTFCKMCSLKIQIPFWRNKLYSNLDELKQQKDKVLNAASSKGFPKEAIEGISAYFTIEELSGFMGAIDGGCGQILKVYREYCVINTAREKFDINEVSKNYAKTSQSTQTQMAFLDNPGRQEALINGVLSGRLVKTGIGLATAAAFDVVKKEIFPSKAQIQVSFGDRVIRYKDYDNFEFMNIGNAEIGFLRFFNLSSEVLFFFSGNSSYDKDKLKKKMPPIYNMINECINDPVNKPTYPVENNSSASNNKDNFEEIRKYKALLDECIISQEEFDSKKKELLGL